MWRRKIGKIPFFIQKTSRTAKRKAGSGLKFMFCEISLNISWWPFLGIAKDTDSPTFSILATLLVECAWWSLKCIDPSLMLSMPFNTNTFLFQMKFDASVLKYKIREKKFKQRLAVEQCKMMIHR